MMPGYSTECQTGESELTDKTKTNLNTLHVLDFSSLYAGIYSVYLPGLNNIQLCFHHSNTVFAAF